MKYRKPKKAWKDRFHKNDYRRINAKMKRFIKAQVKECGDYHTVEVMYTNPYHPDEPDLVSRYARKVAKEMYKSK
jgi:hypothetical protein